MSMEQRNDSAKSKVITFGSLLIISVIGVAMIYGALQSPRNLTLATPHT